MDLDMDWLIILAIGGLVVSVVGSLLWWGFMIYLASNVPRVTQLDFEANLRQLEELIRQAQQSGVDPRLQEQYFIQMGKAQTQFGQLDSLSQQGLDGRLSDISGVAASAGFDPNIDGY